MKATTCGHLRCNCPYEGQEWTVGFAMSSVTTGAIVIVFISSGGKWRAVTLGLVGVMSRLLGDRLERALHGDPPYCIQDQAVDWIDSRFIPRT